MAVAIQQLASDAVQRTEDLWHDFAAVVLSGGHADHATTFEWQRNAVERVILQMRERLDLPLSLDEMAEIAHLSRFHFNRVFSHVTGISPRKFLASLRMEQAKRLLLTTDMSITQVCMEIGYNSLGTFTSHFTAFVGVTPSQWRQLPFQMQEHAGVLATVMMEAAAGRNTDDAFLSGMIHPPPGFQGVIFVGLFDSNIPQSRPVAGDLVVGNNSYTIDPIPPGTYCGLAVAIDQPNDILNFFIPDTMLRGRSAAIVIDESDVRGNADIELRSPVITDPPILIALPALLLDYLKITGML